MTPHPNLRFGDSATLTDEDATDEVARLKSEVVGLRREVAERQSAEDVARAQALVLSRALELLTSEPELDTFLSRVLGVMGEHLDVDAIGLWFYDPPRDTLFFDRVYERGGEGEGSGRVFSGAGLDHPSALWPVASRELPVWAEMNRTRAPVLVRDVASDPRMDLYRQALLDRGSEMVLQVPLLLPGGAIGYLGAATKRREYSAEQLALTQAIAHQMTVAIQLARLAGKQARDAQATAVLDERNRIARDIHDTLAQSLTAVLLQADAARAALDCETPEPGAALRHLSRASALTGEALEEARRAVLALRPSRLEDAGDGPGLSLCSALLRLCDERTLQGPTPIVFLQEGAPQLLSPLIEEGLLRVAQESLSNLAKHAEASAAWLELSFAPHEVVLRVQDNGLGFDPNALRAFEARDDTLRTDGGGFGLPGLRARAESLGGTLTLSSRLGQGTEVRVHLPVGQEENR